MPECQFFTGFLGRKVNCGVQLSKVAGFQLDRQCCEQKKGAL
jgi:hypothetical protein